MLLNRAFLFLFSPLLCSPVLFLCSSSPLLSSSLLLSPLPRLPPTQSFAPRTPHTSFCSSHLSRQPALTPSYTNRFAPFEFAPWVFTTIYQPAGPTPMSRMASRLAEGKLDRTHPILFFSPCCGRKKLVTSTSRTASNDKQLQSMTKELGQASLLA